MSNLESKAHEASHAQAVMLDARHAQQCGDGWLAEETQRFEQASLVSNC